MWKGPTLLMDARYPFTPADKKCLVKKRMSKTQRQVERARLLATLKHDCLIKLESAIEEKGEYYLLFEHVQMPLEKWYLTVTREFIEQYERQLIMFSRYLSDKGILIHFSRENMGVSQAGYPKYFLDPGFEVDPQMDKLSLKKKYKEEIKKEMQFYFDKKAVNTKQVSRVNIPQKKENTKILKILQALQKGKANLCSQPLKEAPHSSQALMASSQGSQLLDGKSTLKPIKNIQNVIIQKEINKVNRIQLMVNNKAVETIHQEFKREYASSSFYINGLPTLVLERQGETKRLLSPGDKFARFEEVKYKEYKSMKTSGQGYVQDFINVLQADDAQKMTSPGSPRATMRGPPKIAITNSPRTTMHGSPQTKQLPSPPARLTIEPDPKSPKSPANKQILPRPPQLKIQDNIMGKNSEIKRAMSPRNDRNRSNLYLSDNAVKAPTMYDPVQIKTSCQFKGVSRTNELQKKVSQAIANSLNAISKFKNAKGQP